MKVEIKKFLNDVYQISITDHPLASKGVPKNVGFCGVAEGSDIAPIAQHGLADSEIEKVKEAVAVWRASLTPEQVEGCCG